MDYGIVFSGKVLAEGTDAQVRENFRKLFPRADDARLQRLFSGQPVLLKKGLSAEQAEKYRQTLRRAGAACEVRRFPATASAPAQPAPTPAPAFTLAPVERPAPAAVVAAPVPEQSVSAVVIKGSGAGYGDLSIMPDAARGLCWGGFFMPWVWGTFNGVRISFLAIPGLRLFRRFLPPWILLTLSMLMSTFMLVRGRELAWQNRNWDSVEHFNRVQRRWTQAGLAFLLLVMVVVPLWTSHAAHERHVQEMAAAAAHAAEQRQMAGDGADTGN